MQINVVIRNLDKQRINRRKTTTTTMKCYRYCCIRVWSNRNSTQITYANTRSIHVLCRNRCLRAMCEKGDKLIARKPYVQLESNGLHNNWIMFSFWAISIFLLRVFSNFFFFNYSRIVVHAAYTHQRCFDNNYVVVHGNRFVYISRLSAHNTVVRTLHMHAIWAAAVICYCCCCYRSCCSRCSFRNQLRVTISLRWIA